MNAQALEHEGAMVELGLEVYSKMKPDALRLQLQTVLITYYEDIKGVVNASGCTPSPRSSSASSWTKMPPTPPPPSSPTSTPPPPPPTPTLMPPPPPPRQTGARRRGTLGPHPAGRSVHRPPALGARAGAARGGGQGVPERVLARPKADAN